MEFRDKRDMLVSEDGPKRWTDISILRAPHRPRVHCGDPGGPLTSAPRIQRAALFPETPSLSPAIFHYHWRKNIATSGVYFVINLIVTGWETLALGNVVTPNWRCLSQRILMPKSFFSSSFIIRVYDESCSLWKYVIW